MARRTPRTRKRPPRRRGRGRPRKPVNLSHLTRLAEIHCTYEEMGRVLGVSTDTLKRNYADHIEKGRARGKQSLRRLQWNAAKKGNATMMIWLGKQLLEQAERERIQWGDKGDQPLAGKFIVELVEAPARR